MHAPDGRWHSGQHDTDDESQPLTLSAWHARAKADLEMHRAMLHQKVDVLIDEQVQRLALDVACIAYTQDGKPGH